MSKGRHGAPPTFVAPFMPAATYADAVILDEVLSGGWPISVSSPGRSDVSCSTGDGPQHGPRRPGNFDANDISTLLGTVANVIDLLTRTACDGFFAP